MQTYITETEVKLPSSDTTLTLTLAPEAQALRDTALAAQRAGRWDPIPTLPLIDAETWQNHSGDDWLLWRAHRTAARLKQMPIELHDGEQIVGRPLRRQPTAQESEQIQEVQPILQQIPPFPGGDAGHFHPDYEKLFTLGIQGIRKEIQTRLSAAGPDQVAFYQACDIAMQGLSEYILRVGDACEEMGRTSEYEQWQSLATICRNVALEPPRTFHEAIQLMFMTIIALWFAEDHGLTTPGRMDQTLRPFYEGDLAAGRITAQGAVELVNCLYIQLNEILHAGSAESVMVGGRDHKGQDVTNELTYLCLVARLATKLVYPTVGLAWHEGTPAELTDFSCQMIRTGIGDPAFFNDELIAQGLRDHGVSEPDSYNYMNSTCVEIKVVGASNMWVTAPYFNCPKALLEVMQQVAEGKATPPETFEELKKRVEQQLASTVRNAAENLDRVWQRRAETGCFPLASCLIHDCLERGLDFDRGGARYHWVENSFVGLANLADSMLAIKHLVYESGEISLADFHHVLKDNYEGQESLRQRILNRIPSYGNDNEAADQLAVEFAEFLQETTESNTIGGHRYVPGFFCWVMHEHMGSDTPATPDGRVSGFPLADGSGAAQGREKTGPTASVISTTKWSHRKALGGLVHNVRFSGNALKGDDDLQGLRTLLETFLQRGGFEIQVNVVSSEMLRDAQQHPENYQDLLVRVAGYSDYFIHLNPNMQAEVIARTEHMEV